MPDTLSTTDINLDANLNLMAAAPLAQKLSDSLNAAVKLDAAQVSHIDQPCLQILIAAARQWHSSGVAFEVQNMSNEFLECLEIVGLNPSIFANKDTA